MIPEDEDGNRRSVFKKTLLLTEALKEAKAGRTVRIFRAGGQDAVLWPIGDGNVLMSSSGGEKTESGINLK